MEKHAWSYIMLELRERNEFQLCNKTNVIDIDITFVVSIFMTSVFQQVFLRVYKLFYTSL